MKDFFDLADKAIAEAYPDCDNRGNGYWGAQRIPNYGILKGAIARIIHETVKAAMKEKDEDLDSLQEEYSEHLLASNEYVKKSVKEIAALKAERRQDALDGQATMDEAYNRIKELEAANQRQAGEISRYRTALGELSNSSNVISDFSRFDSYDVMGPAMSLVRIIAQDALNQNKKEKVGNEEN